MTSVRLQPLSSFDFKTPDEWPQWKCRFKQFCLAPGLLAEDDDRQVSTLLYCMGEDAEDTLAFTNISNADRKKYDMVIGQFDRFFKAQKTQSLSGHSSIDSARDRTNSGEVLPACTAWWRTASMANLRTR